MKIHFKRSIAFIGIVFFLSLLTNLPLIYSSYLLIHTSAYLNGAAQININYVAHNTINENIILELSNFIPNNGTDSIPYIFLGLITTLIIVAYNTAIINLRSKNGILTDKMMMQFALFLSFIFLLFLSSVYFLPISVLFLKFLPLLYVFALPWLSNAIMFAMAIILLPVAMIMSFNYTKKRLLKIGFLITAIFIIGSFVYLLWFIPYLKGTPVGADIISPHSIDIPQHVFQISNFINSQNGEFAVFTLPQSQRGGYNGWQFDTWYAGANFYASLIMHPVYCGFTCFTPYSQEFFPPSDLESYYLNNPIMNTVITNKSVSNSFGIFGIKYIIIQGDTLHNLTNGYENYFSAPKFNLSIIYKNLNTSKNMVFLKKYGNSSVYENLNYVHLVYASNIKNLGNKNLGNSFNYTALDLIKNLSFNIKNTSVFITSIDGFYNDSNTINATPIANFSKPNISFVDNTPTKVTVHVSNAITPYYLVFRETYDPHWAAFYSNGTEVNPRDHIAVNGFANAWYMNKTGNYTITLYYTLQTDAWIAWAVSFAALFVTVGIGVYGWKKKTG